VAARARFGFVVIAMWSAGTACSLLVDTNGLMATGEPDTSPGSLDGPAPEVTPAEASAGDAAQVGDASTDAGFSCNSSAATLCDDFDTAPLGMRWTGTKLVGATMQIDQSGPALSAPGALAIALPENGAGTPRAARLETTFASASALDCRFAVRVDSTSSVADEDVGVLDLVVARPGFSSFLLRLAIAREAIVLFQDGDTADGGAISRTNVLSSYLVGSWARLRVQTDFSKLTLEVNGVSSAAIPVVLDGTPTGSMFMALGATHDSEKPRWGLRLDDLECFVTP
jgi:hypothetical protein